MQNCQNMMFFVHFLTLPRPSTAADAYGGGGVGSQSDWQGDAQVRKRCPWTPCDGYFTKRG